MSLSDNIRHRHLQFTTDGLPEKLDWLIASDVREAVKELKSKIKSYNDFEKMAQNVLVDIDEIFGEELT